MIDPTIHTSGRGFTEGPAVLPDGSVVFTDPEDWEVLAGVQNSPAYKGERLFAA